MQASTPAPRANRIPRIHRQPLNALCRRLHQLQRRYLLWRWRRHAAQLQAEKRNLQHWMAMDQAALLAHRLQYTKSPVLQQRVAEDQAEHARLSALIAAAAGEIEALEDEL
jgi:hypothetical protein